jgi:hypothetical protein
MMALKSLIYWAIIWQSCYGVSINLTYVIVFSLQLTSLLSVRLKFKVKVKQSFKVRTFIYERLDHRYLSKIRSESHFFILEQKESDIEFPL